MSLFQRPSPVDTGSQRWFVVTIVLLGCIIGYSLGTLHEKSASRIPSSDNVDSDPYAQSSSEESWSSSAYSSEEHVVSLPPEITPADHVQGDRNAPIALVEYSDLQCPYCTKVHPTIQQVMKEYPGKVMWVYRHYPLSFHDNAQSAAEASECVAEVLGNDGFWKFVDGVFADETGEGTAPEKLAALAQSTGVNAASFSSCLASGKFTQRVKDQLKAAEDAGVQGTPGVYVLDVQSDDMKFIDGAYPYETFKQYIDELLQ